MNIEFSQKQSKKFNNLGLRATYGISICKIKDSFEDLSVFTADTSTSAGLDRFRKIFPEKFITKSNFLFFNFFINF